MTMADESRPVADMGNPLITKARCMLDTGKVQTPAGELGVATIRTETTTLTLMLDAKELRTWIGRLEELSGQLSGAGLTVVKQQSRLIRPGT